MTFITVYHPSGVEPGELLMGDVQELLEESYRLSSIKYQHLSSTHSFVADHFYLHTHFVLDNQIGYNFGLICFSKEILVTLKYFMGCKDSN